VIVPLTDHDFNGVLSGIIPWRPQWDFVCCTFAEQQIVAQDRLNQALLGSGWVYNKSEHALIQVRTNCG
jgi:hypothetical protein